VKPPPFEYVRAGSLDEALAALADGGDDAKPIAGGQSLVPALNMRVVRPTRLVDIGSAGLDGIARENGHVRVGATTTQRALERSPDCPPLVREALAHVGHPVTRNRGTVGGSIAHADGAAELCLCLAALDGTVVTDRREIPAREFFVTHYTTVLEPGELVTATLWPVGESAVAFEELSLRAGDYALAMAAVAGSIVAVGAVTDRPAILAQVGELLEREPRSEELARAAGALAAGLVEPPGHAHADARYLTHLTGVLVERALRRSWTSS
jgi:carbon-monoxide dehydrogenase medium subunit